ncbi:MAG: hypothetical protein ACF8OB_06415 [Phycisphaeraceae bacterium JB051]
MNRTLKYTLWSGGLTFLFTALQLGMTELESSIHFVGGLLLVWPSALICSLLYGDTNGDFQTHLIRSLFTMLLLNTVCMSVFGMLMAWASVPLDKKHRKRIWYFGRISCYLFCGVTAAAFILLNYQYDWLWRHPMLMYVTLFFTGPGLIQAWSIWGRSISAMNPGWQSFALGLPFNALVGFGVGCLIAIFTSRWAKFKNPNGCPKCDYDLTGTPEHCPECGWAKDTKTPTSTP